MASRPHEPPHRFLRLNGILCRTADGATGFRPSDVFGGLPLQPSPQEDCPLRETQHNATPQPGSPPKLDSTRPIAPDSDCTVFNTFGVLTGGVVMDVRTRSFVDFASRDVFVPLRMSDANDKASAQVEETSSTLLNDPQSDCDLCVASSLTPYNTRSTRHVLRRRVNSSTRSPKSAEDAYHTRRIARVIERMARPAVVVPPEIAFPLQHEGAYMLRRCMRRLAASVNGVVPDAISAFTCFSGRRVWYRARGPRRDPIVTAKRPLVALAMFSRFRDAGHATDSGTMVRTTGTLTPQQRLSCLPRDLQDWTLHWWVFSRFVDYLDVQTDPPLLLPVSEDRDYYVSRATQALDDVAAGDYQQPPRRAVARCWHKLVCETPAALRLRLVRFETFFEYVAARERRGLAADA